MPDRSAEITLDPASWNEVRAEGHRLLDELLDWLGSVRERPAWRPMPEEARAAFRRPVPQTGEGLSAVLEEFRRWVLHYPIGNVHPRFWGWVQGSGSASGILAELATAACNVNAWGGQQAAPMIELQVIEWCRTLFGFPAGTSGVMVTGGSVANLVALAAARDAAGPEIPRRGLGAVPGPLVLYASTEVHNSVLKAAQLLGLGREAVRLIPVDDNFRIDLARLQRAIGEDRAAGRRPFCVVGTAGTVNTGATDDLAGLADLAARERLWFHVDGAFGALAALSSALRPIVAGMDRADSLAFDFHKWLHVPYDAGCVLVRDAAAHRRSFTVPASYLTPLDRGTAAGPVNLSELGPELSRGARALKVWLLLKEHGVNTYAALVEQNVAQAAHLAARVSAHPELELLAPAPLNIVCLRYAPQPRSDHPEELDGLNREVLMRIQEQGVAVPSSTLVGGRFAIRVCISNHRTRREDLDGFLAAVVDIGGKVLSEERPRPLR